MTLHSLFDQRRRKELQAALKMGDLGPVLGKRKPVPDVVAPARTSEEQEELNRALRFAADKGDTRTVEELISKGADLNGKDNTGLTALICAARNGYTETAEMLISKGADVNAKDNDGWMALMYAAGIGFTATIEKLIYLGADVNAKDNNGETALKCAVKNGNTETAEMLKRHGATE